MILVARILNVFVKFWILEVYICHTRRVLLLCWFFDPIVEVTYGEPLELHNILSQCASFVTEYVMDHTQLLIQIGRLYGGLQTSRLIEHCDVPRNEVRLDKVNQLQRHQK